MPETVASTVEHIRTELQKVIVGQDDAIEQILIALLAEGHALIEGVPGTAKTLTVKTLSRIINASFSRIQFTPDLMPSDITGTNVFNIANSTFTCGVDRYSQTSCWPTRSIARRPKRRRRCWKRWKNAR
jgi:MoxR-like ATPase